MVPIPCFTPTLQNAFSKGEFDINTSRNYQYLIVFKSPAYRKHIEIVSQRIFPEQDNEFISICNKETNKLHGYILVDNTPSTYRDSKIVTDIFNFTQKIPISCDSYESQGFDSSNVLVYSLTSSTIFPTVNFDAVFEEDKENRAISTSKRLISVVWILDSYGNIDREIARAPFLEQLPADD